MAQAQRKQSEDLSGGELNAATTSAQHMDPDVGAEVFLLDESL